MLERRLILTLIMSFTIISWEWISRKIFYVGEILKTLNTRLEPVLQMMGR